MVTGVIVITEPHVNGTPKLEPIKNGWAARGDGWAVHAPTQEEAITRFREAEQRHREIDARPFWSERSQGEAEQEA